jgi:hypothetical protein
MSIEAYTLTVAMLATIALLWWIVSELIERRQNTHLHIIIKEQQEQIDKLKHENSNYYAKFGVIKENREG